MELKCNILLLHFPCLCHINIILAGVNEGQAMLNTLYVSDASISVYHFFFSILTVA